MRILMVHPHDIQYHPWTIRIVEFAERLGRRGHQVTLAYIASEYAWEPESARGPATQLSSVGVVPLQRAGRTLAAELRRLVAGAELIHFQKANPSTALPSLWAAWRAGIPVHYDWDDNETGLIQQSEAPESLKNLTAKYERELPRMVESLTSSSAAIRELALERGADSSRLFDAPVGADTERFQPDIDGSAKREEFSIPLDRRCVLWAGQMEAADYAARLLGCVEQVREKCPEVLFVFVGSGPGLDGLKKVCREMNLEDAVCFTGRVEPLDMPQVLAMADVIAAPLDDDPIARCKSPLKIAEAMAMGKPIVSCSVGEAVTMLEDCGMLVSPGDEAAFSEGILGLLLNPAKAVDLGRAARRRGETSYNWDWSVDQLERAYAKAMDRTE